MKTVAVAILAALAASSALGAPPGNFEQTAEAARAAIGVPGMAIAIVENDQVTFAHGFGVRALGRR